MSIVVAAFYKFVKLPDYVNLRSPLLECCLAQGIRGTILLAAEGINGTIAGTRQGIDAVLAAIRSDDRFADLEHKESMAIEIPFDRLKVRLKREIVTLGIPEVDPTEQVGTYVEPQDWNDLITDPDVTLVDTRNQYEFSIGTFHGAKNPATATFRQFPNYVEQQLDPAQHRKVALFCTGGIRCEKATAYMLAQGFEEVYHLKGGILKYLEEVPPEKSLWQGECFVFDQRVAVQQGLELGTHEMCQSCGHPISEQDKASADYEAGVACPHCVDRAPMPAALQDRLTPEKRAHRQGRHQQR